MAVEPPNLATSVALSFSSVSVWDQGLDGRLHLLKDVDWTVRRGEHWAVLGPNGAGKTTLLEVAAAARYPSRGRVFILGAQLGHVDVRELRAGIGRVDVKTEAAFAGHRSVLDITLTGATGSIALLEDRCAPDDRQRALSLLRLFGCETLAQRPFGRCSQGERRRVLLARSLMHQPSLLLLDEPADGLDLPGREALLASLEALSHQEPSTSLVLVTHHVEELPSTMSHALLLRRGRVLTQGPVAEVMDDGAFSECFGTAVRINSHEGRWTAHARPGWHVF